MGRGQVAIRPAHSDDLPELDELWSELRESGGRFARAIDAGDARQRLAELARYENGRLLVAEIDDVVVGMAFVVKTPLLPLQEATAVHVGYINVRTAHRRRGIGRRLIAAVLDYAEEVEASHVSVAVDPTMREANRFFARLGMRPLMTHRSASVAVLRRRLATEGFRADVAADLIDRRRRFLTRSRIRAVMTRLAEREEQDNEQPPGGAGGEDEADRELGTRPAD